MKSKKEAAEIVALMEQEYPISECFPSKYLKGKYIIITP